MSKKMLKRSLALGALMAFVITGSAMAQYVHPGCEYNGVGSSGNRTDIFEYSSTTLKNNYTLEGNISWTGFRNNSSNPDYNTTYLNGYKLTIINKNAECAVHHGKHYDYKGGTGDSAFTICEDLHGYEFISGDSEELGDLEIISNHMGLHGYGKIDVNNLKISSGSGNAIQSGDADSNSSWMPYTKTEIYANSVNIEANGSNAIQAHNNMEIGKVDDKVGALTISGNYDRAIRVNGKADEWNGVTPKEELSNMGVTVNVYADTLNISDAKESIKVDDKGILNLNANKGIITNEFYAAKDGAIEATLGAGVEWTGKFVTDTDATKGALDLSGKWTLKDVASDTTSKVNSLTNATFRNGSTFVIEGADYENNDGNNEAYALNGVGSSAKLTVENGAKIVITDGKLDTVYNVAKDFATNEGANWALQADNALWYVDWTDLDNAPNTLQGTIKAKTANALVEEGIATNDNKEILSAVAAAPVGENATVDAIKEVTSAESNLTSDQQQKAIAAVLQVGEAGGFTGNVVSVSKQVNGSVGARNSFSGPKHGGPRHRGGHGPSVIEDANGSAIWAQYVHGKDKVDGIDMGGTENAYESQFNGVVLGADFKQVGSYASGIAFNYGEGDSHSKKNVVQSDSEFDFWGVSYYGAVKKQDTNFIFDIGYSESDSDVEQKFGTSTITANPEASTWTAGVKVEKLIDKGAVQIVPYAGLRFMTIDTDDYEAKGGASEATYYSTERQNIWLLPVGVSLSQENVYDSGWIVTPKADLSYTWAMGDTDSSMTVNMPNVGSDTLGYTVMDDGSFMATVGIDAQKEDWTFGVAYSYQKGDSTRSDRWYVNARYSF